MRRALFYLMLMLLFTAACTKKRTKVSLPPAMKSVKKGYTEEGVASWYGHPYHGRKTSNGETYNMNDLTAAHQTLPFGVWVEVKNKKNNQTVTVRINDRGPFVGGRIIDLSKAAAGQIDMIRTGVAPVKIKVVRTN